MTMTGGDDCRDKFLDIFTLLELLEDTDEASDTRLYDEDLLFCA